MGSSFFYVFSLQTPAGDTSRPATVLLAPLVSTGLRSTMHVYVKTPADKCSLLPATLIQEGYAGDLIVTEGVYFP